MTLFLEVTMQVGQVTASTVQAVTVLLCRLLVDITPVLCSENSPLYLLPNTVYLLIQPLAHRLIRNTTIHRSKT
jgi:hypothetical protein